jgi:hypothetical protein
MMAHIANGLRAIAAIPGKTHLGNARRPEGRASAVFLGWTGEVTGGAAPGTSADGAAELGSADLSMAATGVAFAHGLGALTR